MSASANCQTRQTSAEDDFPAAANALADVSGRCKHAGQLPIALASALRRPSLMAPMVTKSHDLEILDSYVTREGRAVSDITRAKMLRDIRAAINLLKRLTLYPGNPFILEDKVFGRSCRKQLALAPEFQAYEFSGLATLVEMQPPALHKFSPLVEIAKRTIEESEILQFIPLSFLSRLDPVDSELAHKYLSAFKDCISFAWKKTNLPPEQVHADDANNAFYRGLCSTMNTAINLGEVLYGIRFCIGKSRPFDHQIDTPVDYTITKTRQNFHDEVKKFFGNELKFWVAKLEYTPTLGLFYHCWYVTSYKSLKNAQLHFRNVPKHTWLKLTGEFGHYHEITRRTPNHTARGTGILNCESESIRREFCEMAHFFSKYDASMRFKPEGNLHSRFRSQNI
ncbi:MAG: hypothetical protein V4505_05375 [Pseudomonadota bacterium]